MKRQKGMSSRQDVRLGMVGILSPGQGNVEERMLSLFKEYGGVIRDVTDIACSRPGMVLKCVTIEATTNDLGAFTGKLGLMAGVKVKSFLL